MKTLLALSAINAVVPMAVNQGAEIHVNSPNKRQALWNHLDFDHSLFAKPRYILSNIKVESATPFHLNLDNPGHEPNGEIDKLQHDLPFSESFGSWWGNHNGWEHKISNNDKIHSLKIHFNYTDNLTLESQDIYLYYNVARDLNINYAFAALMPGEKIVPDQSWGHFHKDSNTTWTTSKFHTPTSGYWSTHPWPGIGEHSLNSRIKIPALFGKKIDFVGMRDSNALSSLQNGLKLTCEYMASAIEVMNDEHINSGNYMDGFQEYEGDKNLSHGIEGEYLLNHVAYDTALYIYKTLNATST